MLFLLTLLLSLFSSLALRSIYSSDFKGPSPLWYEPEMVEHALTLLRTFRAFTGRPLVEVDLERSYPEEAAKALFFTDRVVLSHGTQTDENGPILNYGNNAGLHLWRATWEELTTMPSKSTAGAEDQQARAATMDTVARCGFVEHYSGVRVALDGSRFRIEDVTIWNVFRDGTRIGQAATFPRWTPLR